MQELLEMVKGKVVEEEDLGGMIILYNMFMYTYCIICILAHFVFVWKY